MNPKILIFLCLYTVTSLKSPVSADSANCSYKQTSNYLSRLISDQKNGYMCTLTLNSRDDLVNQIVGTHKRRQTDNNVNIIKISQNSEPYLTTFPGEFCKKFKNLEIIDMCYAEIETIEDNSLDQCTNLKSLQFYSNKIDELPEYLLARTKKLEKLVITSNYIKNLPENFLSGLTLLTILDLSDNKFDQIPSESFNDLNSLKKLNLERNKLKELDQNLFKNVQNLEELKLNNNEISDLPHGLFSSLSNLKNLNMQYNKLTVIHAASFPQQAQINIVAFSYNKINAIDEAFITNCRVNSLKMAGNVCENAPQTRSYEMKQKLQSCFKNYRLTKTKLTPWITGCGKVKVGTQTIIMGTKVDKGTHPWIAALIDNSKGYFCGGSLITKRLVLTAAHCVVELHSEKKPKDITVILGAHQLNNSNDIGKRSYEVETIKPHDDWNPHTDKFDADIAILRLSDDVTFSIYIQPVCLASLGVNLVNYNNGSIVGFGRTEKTASHSNFPIKANTPIRTSDDCYAEFPSILNIASRRTFCGGFANGTGACTGDSGSGLTIVENEVHYLRGIVSASLRDEKYGCDVESYSIFTDMKFYLNFIRQFVRQFND